jgi:hypothetical protein
VGDERAGPAGPGASQEPRRAEGLLDLSGDSDMALGLLVALQRAGERSGHVSLSGSAAKSLVGKKVKILFNERRQAPAHRPGKRAVRDDGTAATSQYPGQPNHPLQRRGRQNTLAPPEADQAPAA